MKIQIDLPNTKRKPETWPLKRLRVYGVKEKNTIGFASNAMNAFEFARQAGHARTGLWASEWVDVDRDLNYQKIKA